MGNLNGKSEKEQKHKLQVPNEHEQFLFNKKNILTRSSRKCDLSESSIKMSSKSNSNDSKSSRKENHRHRQKSTRSSKNFSIEIDNNRLEADKIIHNGRRLSRMSSGDEELRQRIQELTTNPADDSTSGDEAGHVPSPHSPPTVDGSFPPYPLWDNPNNGEFERWLLNGTNDGVGWRRNVPPPFSAWDDDFLWLFPFGKTDLHRKNQQNAETTYRTAFTPKLMPKPVRAKGPKDNFTVTQHSGIGYPLTRSTSNHDDFLEYHNNWLLDRSLNCRARKALGALHQAKPRSGHYYFDTSPFWHSQEYPF